MHSLVHTCSYNQLVEMVISGQSEGDPNILQRGWYTVFILHTQEKKWASMYLNRHTHCERWIYGYAQKYIMRTKRLSYVQGYFFGGGGGGGINPPEFLQPKSTVRAVLAGVAFLYHTPYISLNCPHPTERQKPRLCRKRARPDKMLYSK